MTIFAQDTFVGTNGTALRARVADSGGSWVYRYFDLTGFSDTTLEISTNRARKRGYGGDAGDSWSYLSGIAPQADHEVSMDVVVIGTYGAMFEVALTLHGTVDNAVRGYILAAPTYVSPRIEVIGDGPLYSGSGAGAANNNTVNGSAGTHTIKFDVVGNVYTLYWDGVQVHQRTLTEMPNAGRVGLQLSSSAFTIGDLAVDNFLAQYTEAPPPPSVFWMDNVRTREIL